MMTKQSTAELDLNEMERAYIALLQRTLDECIEPRVLAEPDGTTFPALVDTESGEVLALLCMPPRAYNKKAVN